MTAPGLTDSFGRQIRYIRLSITDRCNFRCVYCMPEQGVPSCSHEAILTFEEILRFCAVAARMGISRFKITGGEPLCRKGAADFMRSLKSLPGVEQVTLTTNGSLLPGQVDALAAMGLDAINVSLDSLDQQRMRALTRNPASVATILEGIRNAQNCGIPIKINTVPMQGYNDADILPLTRYCLENGIHIRFIELMPVGFAKTCKGIDQQYIMDSLQHAFGSFTPVGHPLGNGPAVAYTVPGFASTVGFISALSHKFCATCNRIRMTSQGYIKTCLYHNTGLDMRPFLRSCGPDQKQDSENAGDNAIAAALRQAVWEKPRAHDFSYEDRPASPDRFAMSSVGG